MEKIRLENGTTLLAERAGHLPLVALQVWVQFGSADEPASLAGIAHLIEHMLFKGIEGRPPGELAKKIEAWGGSINAWTSYDQTVYHLVVPRRHAAKAMELLALSVQRPAFDPEELEREKLVVLEEIRQGKDSPGHLCSEQLFKTAYRRHPYHRPIIGYADRVRRMTRADLIQVHRAWYRPEHTTVVLVGDLRERAILDTAARLFGDAWQVPAAGDAISRSRRTEPTQRSPRLAFSAAPTNLCHFALGFHATAFLHEDTAALEVLTVLLGQGESSRLNVELQRKRALCSEAYGYFYSPRDPGLLVVGGVTAPDRLTESVRVTTSILGQVALGRISSAEVDKARNIVLSDVLFDGETIQGLARRRGSYETIAGDPDYEAQYLEALRRVSPGKVAEVAARYLDSHRATLSVVHPKDSRPDERLLKEALLGSLPSPRTACRRFQKTSRGIAHTRLASGLRLAVQPDPSRALVAVRVGWLGGALAESPKQAGLAHLTAEMLVRGTQDRPGEMLVREADALGATLTPIPGRHTCGLLLEVPSEHLGLSLELLADALFHSAFDAEAFERTRRVLQDEIRHRADDALAVAMDEFRKALFGARHPYGRPLLGTLETVRNLTVEQARTLHARTFRAGNTVVAMAGDVAPEEAATLVERLFRFPERRAPKVRIPGARYPSRPKRVTRQLERNQAQIVLGFPGPDLLSQERFAVHVLTTVLGSQSGRLFVNLRDKLGLAYRVSATSMEGLAGGYVVAYLATEQGRVAEAIEALRREIEQAAAGSFGTAEIREAKRHLAGSHLNSLQRRASQARGMALNMLYGRSPDQHLQYAESIERVRLQDVQQAARKYLDPRRAVLVVVQDAKAHARAGI